LSTPNWAQIASLIRTLVPFVGGLLVMRGVVNATQYDSLINQLGTVVTDVTVALPLLTAVATGVWGLFTHTDAAVVKAAANVPGVTSIQVAPAAAAPSVVSVAQDGAVPNVTVAFPPSDAGTANAHP
jgi:hypothetical protein